MRRSQMFSGATIMLYMPIVWGSRKPVNPWSGLRCSQVPTIMLYMPIVGGSRNPVNP